VNEPLFQRVLVANRGEIAVRVIRACRELGIGSVAVYSDVDAASGHVAAADEAIRIGPAPATESYLDITRVIAAARSSGADAIHPGYGFLSERAEFAVACADAGLVFVGPEASTLAGLGDKLAARRTAREAGVAILPGAFEPADIGGDDGAAQRVADEAAAIGWPLFVKAAAGGGGRGMRRVDSPADLPAALVSASQEARAAFGDGAVYLERFVQIGRHVEVQLLGDADGTIVALGERDCSTQRRNQKLVEEAPAPGLTRAQRVSLHARAVTIARAVGLRNAATAEFLLRNLAARASVSTVA
jgi:acetyl/propionyl-CoA carboxylase alpha subunit